MNVTEILISGKMIRWMGWASLWTIFHPELTRFSEWGESPLVVIESLLMYAVSGVVLELTYNRLMWGQFTLSPKKRAERPDSAGGNQWYLFIERMPPMHTTVEMLCEDKQVRQGKVIEVRAQQLVFEIEYEDEIEDRQRVRPNEFSPTFWRELGNQQQESE